MSMLNWQGWDASWLGWGLAESVAPPPATGGGDRGINLLREKPKEERQKLPRPAKVKIYSRQPAQETSGRIEVSAQVSIASQALGIELAGYVEALTEMRILSRQRHASQMFTKAGPLEQKQISVRPYLEPARGRIVSESGRNEVRALVEVE